VDAAATSLPPPVHGAAEISAAADGAEGGTGDGPRAVGNRAANHTEQRSWAQPFCEAVGSILRIPELCDVTFLVGPEAEPVHGVRAVLAVRSEVFRSMLIGDRWLEQQPGRPSEIPMPENSPAAFRAMMQYVRLCDVIRGFPPRPVPIPCPSHDSTFATVACW
jgi:hypothetical protein